MSNLIHLEQQLLTHNLERANFARIFLSSQIDLPVPTLTDLRENLEITITKSRPTLPQERTFSTKVLGERCLMF